MNPPIEPKPEQVTSDAQGKVLDMVAEQENIEGVYAPPAVPKAAPQNSYHDIMMGYGPPPVLSPEMQHAILHPAGLVASGDMEKPEPAALPGMMRDFFSQVKPAVWLNDTAWKCTCGAENEGKFCTECGAAAPEKPKPWVCTCGTENKGKFCTECGKSRPEAWVCGCGTENSGKFCTSCGSPRR